MIIFDHIRSKSDEDMGFLIGRKKMKKLTVLTIMTCLSVAGTMQAQTFFLNDRPGFDAALKPIKCIDFEGWTTEGGQAGAYSLTGDEFPGITLSAGADAEGLFVGIPIPGYPSSDNSWTFYGNDFVPTSGVACLSPDLTNDPAPIGGVVHIVFAEPVDGIGGYFLDAETEPGNGSYIQAYCADGLLSPGRLWIGSHGDNSQVFAGIVAPGIVSADIALGYGTGEGVGLDDLCYGWLFIEVCIDIKPGSDPNPINPDSNGLVPVAIFSSPEFDATQVDPTSVSLAGAGVAVRGKDKLMAHVEDVDEDGLLDLVVQVETQSFADLGEGGTVELTGTTFGGRAIVGYDDVIAVPPE